jgi:hypothetical protein
MKRNNQRPGPKGAVEPVKKSDPQSPSSIFWGWYNRAMVAAVPSGVSLTPLIIIIKK